MIKKIYSILVLCFFSLFAKAQPDSILKVYANQFQEERLFIHFDKSNYSPGETIWFKVYLMQGLELSDISKTVYVDFIDSAGKTIKQFTAPVILSSAKGEFSVPENYTAGNLYIKAYTSWMLNYDSAFLYRKTINILQPLKESMLSKKPTTTIHFLPEGGSLVNGIKSKIAFKAITNNGLPCTVKGAVFSSSNGALIDSVVSIHDGMGYFYLTPNKGESYTVKWKDEWKTEHISNIPAIEETGVVMHVNQKDKKIFIEITRQDAAPEAHKLLRIVATLQKQMVFRGNVKLYNNNTAVIGVPVEQFPGGIIQLTIFDMNWKPLAERICFIKNQDIESLADARLVKPSLTPKAKNTLEINIPDTITSNLSVSITDAGTTNAANENIISGLLLTSDLKGYVHNPVFYFQNDADSTNQFLDLVMLTNGWRKINWQDVSLSKVPTIKHPRDTGFINIQGTVLGTTANLLRDAGDINVIIKTKDSSVKFYSLPIDKYGKFAVENTIFFDTASVFYQFNKNKNLVNVATIGLENSLIQASKNNVLNNAFDAKSKNDTLGDYKRNLLWQEQLKLNKLLGTTTLEGVTVKAKSKTSQDVFDTRYASSLFKNPEGILIDLMNETSALGAIDIFSYLRGRIPGLTINNTGANVSVTWRQASIPFYLDEMRVDADLLRNISVRDIAYVKLIRESGPATGLAVYTRKAEDVAPIPGKSLENKKVAGYTYVKEFYAPNYDKQPELKYYKDVRTTLYWNPFVLLDKKSRTILLPFFNNDDCKKIRINIQGFNTEGKLISIEKVVQ